MNLSLIPSRRGFVAGVVSAGALADAAQASDRLATLEAKVGGRLGVAAQALTTGARFGHRADERFPMCSTFKAMAVAALLARVDRDADHLDRFVRFGEADLLSHSPVTSGFVRNGGAPLRMLCAAALDQSDNTAANLILASIGGPSGWTAFVRALGDHSSRLDRTEPTLNSALPGDGRDTTTPLAMLNDLRVTLAGKFLSQGSREQLGRWMEACQTGKDRLRAGLPASWRVADKTGSGDHGTANDIAVAWTPAGPLAIAAYLTGAESASSADREAALAEVGRIVAETLAPSASAVRHG